MRVCVVASVCVRVLASVWAYVYECVSVAPLRGCVRVCVWGGGGACVEHVYVEHVCVCVRVLVHVYVFVFWRVCFCVCMCACVCVGACV